MSQRLQILITNDDSINAPGLRALIQIARSFGDITVVAPKDPQSAMGMAVSMGKILRLKKVSEEPGVVQYYCTGTPTDCVKIAMSELFTDRKPDLLLSGVNHGSNASAAAIYSGTLAACAEATRYNIPAVGYSLRSHSEQADFTPVVVYGTPLLRSFIENVHLPQDTYLNVNFPNIPASRIQGIRFARLGRAHWIREFEKRTDPIGNPYYWLVGTFVNRDPLPAVTDYNLLEQGYITITPLHTDNTFYAEMERLEKSWDIPFKTQ